MFRVGSLTRQTTRTVCCVTRGETAPNSAHVWEGGLLDIPEVVPTSRRKLIQIKYTITVGSHDVTNDIVGRVTKYFPVT